MLAHGAPRDDVDEWLARAATGAREDAQDGPYDRLPADREYRASDLTVWRDATRGLRHAMGPVGLPVVVTSDGRVTGVFALGHVRSVDTASGERRWTATLGPYVNGCVGYGDRVVVTLTDRIVCLDSLGRQVWVHAPHRRGSECVYSRAAVAGGRVFFGDRRGYLHCLNAATGALEWSALTSHDDNNQVNADPLVLDDRVIVGANSALVLCHDAATGERIWRFAVDGPVDGRLLLRAGNVWASTGSALYCINPETGDLIETVERLGNSIQSYELAGDTLLLSLQPCDARMCPTREPPYLSGVRGGVEVYRLPYARYVGADLGYCAQTGLVYEASRMGLGMVDPVVGRRVASIRAFHRALLAGDDLVSLPRVIAGVLYVSTDHGSIVALRHPTFARQPAPDRK